MPQHSTQLSSDFLVPPVHVLCHTLKSPSDALPVADLLACTYTVLQQAAWPVC